MRSNDLFTAIADRLVPDCSEDDLFKLSKYVLAAEIELRAGAGIAYEVLSESAREEMLRSLRQSLAWMSRFGLGEEFLRAAVSSWVSAQREMLMRLYVDRAEIESHFFQGSSCDRVVSVALGLSDWHDQGRSVAALTFDSGQRLVYKPREMGIDDWFFRFLDLLNSEWIDGYGATRPFGTLRVLNRNGYGWMEFASHVPCRDADELRGYYRNAGALLCVLYVVGATDCHFQNLLACGEYPILIDAETLFQPRLAAGGNSISVIRTGMISGFRGNSENRLRDVGALSCARPLPIPLEIATGGDLRPDAIMLEPDENSPFPVGVEATPKAFHEELVDGFTRTYRFLIDRRSALLADIARAASLRVRYAFRDTLDYYQVIVRALRSGSMSHLSLSPLSSSRLVFRALEAVEAHSLANLDIPRFTLPAFSRELCGIPDCFPESGYELVCDGIRRLSEADMELQLAVIRWAWSLDGVVPVLS